MQLLINKIDFTVYLKGRYLEVRASSSPFGGNEPDKFVLIHVLNLPMTDYLYLDTAWERIIEYEIVSSNPTVDGYRIRLYSPLIDSANKGQITLAEVEAFINGWGGTVFSSGTNEVVFDILIGDAIQSQRFWRINLTNVVFTENSYTQATGIHELEIDYSAANGISDYAPSRIEKYVTRKGGVVLSHQDEVVTAEFHRSDVRTLFQEDIRLKSQKIIEPKRYYVGTGVVDYIVGQGGEITIDISTLLSYIHDSTED